MGFAFRDDVVVEDDSNRMFQHPPRLRLEWLIIGRWRSTCSRIIVYGLNLSRANFLTMTPCSWEIALPMCKGEGGWKSRGSDSVMWHLTGWKALYQMFRKTGQAALT